MMNFRRPQARRECMTIVKIDLDGGQRITASVTKDAVEDLGLAVGSPVIAVIKSTEVMVGIEWTTRTFHRSNRWTIEAKGPKTRTERLDPAHTSASTLWSCPPTPKRIVRLPASASRLNGWPPPASASPRHTAAVNSSWWVHRSLQSYSS